MTADRDKRDAVLNELAVLAKHDKAAMDRLILMQGPLIEHVIRRHCKRARTSNIIPDLMQDGRRGVARAVTMFDAGKGSFWTYCYTWVRAYVWAYANANLEAVARKTSLVGGKQVRQPWARTLSFDAPTNFHQSDVGDDRTWLDVLADERDVDDEVQETHRAVACRTLAMQVLALLSEREQFVLCHRFAAGTSLDAVGEDVGWLEGSSLSRERVRQVEEGSLRALRKALQYRQGSCASFEDFLTLIPAALADRKATTRWSIRVSVGDRFEWRWDKRVYVVEDRDGAWATLWSGPYRLRARVGDVLVRGAWTERLEPREAWTKVS